jgi:hypothetical protein
MISPTKCFLDETKMDDRIVGLLAVLGHETPTRTRSGWGVAVLLSCLDQNYTLQALLHCNL